jgi:hypothetical protein
VISTISVQEWADHPKAIKTLRISRRVKIDTVYTANAFQREYANNPSFLVTRLLDAPNILTSQNGGQRCCTSLPFPLQRSDSPQLPHTTLQSEHGVAFGTERREPIGFILRSFTA